MSDIRQELNFIIEKYSHSFSVKDYNPENEEHDVLMDAFGITPELKRENRQYWGRELGMCWQLLVSKVASINCESYKPAFKIGEDEPIDLCINKDAIDTKYRIGSGDSGTLKKFKQYGEMLEGKGYRPVILILRNDNLNAAITALQNGGWTLYIGKRCFKYILDNTKFDLESYLDGIKDKYNLKRLK
jgi:hypothetical protein